MTMHKALPPRDDRDRLYVSRKEGGRGLANIEDCVETQDYTRKSKDKFLMAANNSRNDRWTNRKTTKTRKQKWEEKRLYGHFKRQIGDVVWTGYTRKDLDVVKKRKP